MEEKKLIMTFKNTLGNTFSITVEDPRNNLEEQNIIDAMELIKNKNIFQPNGYDLSELVSAKIVDTTTTSFDLVI